MNVSVCLSMHPRITITLRLNGSIFLHVNCDSGLVPSGGMAIRYALPLHIVVTMPRARSVICDCMVADAVDSECTKDKRFIRKGQL